MRSPTRLIFLSAVLAVTLMSVGAPAPTVAASPMPLAAPTPQSRGASPGAPSCSGTHWVGSWAASPTGEGGLFDPSLNLSPPVYDETIRAELTPTMGGSTVRVHLSNRFGSQSVTLPETTIAIAGAGSTLATPATPVTFGGEYPVTLAPGQDVVSDPVNFSFVPGQTLAVSMYVVDYVGTPSGHFTALQTSYLTGSGSGNHTEDTGSNSFSQMTTSRPYVDGVDVLAPASAGAVVALGDSLTDGYQPSSIEITPSPAATNANGSWPDDLARRLIAANIPLSVLNAGISGNRVLAGSGTAGLSALDRLGPDVLSQAGVTTVIWLEGTNDITESPNATADDLEAAYTQGIAEMHAAGLKVLQGTLTPTPGDANTEMVSQQVNDWIRSSSPADGVIDFDAAVRDPSNPSVLNPAYNGGDGLHLSLAGYQAMANAVDLSSLRTPSCAPPGLRLTVTPHRVRAGRRVALHFEVTVAGSGRRQPLAGASVAVGTHRSRTNAGGRAVIALRFTGHGQVRVRGTATGYGPGEATIQVTAARHKRR